MQMDIPSLILANLIFSIKITPIVVIIVSILRAAILFSGQKREFEDWTRNPLLTVLLMIFLPGTLAYVAIRYVVCYAFGIDIEGVGSATTYGEINLFLTVDKAPRVGIAITSLFVTIVMSIFVALSLVAIPIVLVFDVLPTLVCWYISLGILFNSSIRNGDISMIGASLKRRPRSGAVELLVVMTALVLLYIQVMGVSM